MRFEAKVPGPKGSHAQRLHGFQLRQRFRRRSPPAYERLIGDAMRGDQTLFTRWDAVERAWEIVTPILEVWKNTKDFSFPNYAAGSQGPESAHELFADWRACDLARAIEVPVSGRTLGTEPRSAAATCSVATMTLVVLLRRCRNRRAARDRIHTLASKHPSRVIVLDASHDDEPAQRRGPATGSSSASKTSAPEMLRSAVCTLRFPTRRSCCFGRLGHRRRRALRDALRSSRRRSSTTARCSMSVTRRSASWSITSSNIPQLPLGRPRLSAAGALARVRRDFLRRRKRRGALRSARVEIACGSEPEAYYLLGWLASRLQWTPRSRRTRWQLQPASEIAFDDSRVEASRAAFARVALSTSRSNFVAEVDESAETILLSVTGSSRHGAALPRDQQPRHRGAGRARDPLGSRTIASFDMRSPRPARSSQRGRERCMTGRGELQVFRDATRSRERLADLFVATGTHRDGRPRRFHVALSGGNTPRAAYELLAQEPLRRRAFVERRLRLFRRRALRAADRRAVELPDGAEGVPRRRADSARQRASHRRRNRSGPCGQRVRVDSSRRPRQRAACSIWCCSGSAPTDTPRRSFPERRPTSTTTRSCAPSTRIADDVARHRSRRRSSTSRVPSPSPSKVPIRPSARGRLRRPAAIPSSIRRRSSIPSRDGWSGSSTISPPACLNRGQLTPSAP